MVNLTFCPSATCDASICSECERTDKGFICSDTKKCGDGSTCTKVISTDTATLAYCLSADKAGTLQCKALPSSGPTCNAQYAGNKDACYLKGSAEGLVYCEATGQCCDVCPKPQPCTGGSQCTKPDGTIGKCDPMSLQCY